MGHSTSEKPPLRQRAKQLLSGKAIAGWLLFVFNLIKFVWNRLGDIGTARSMVSTMKAVWDFLLSSSGTIAVLIVGFALLLWAVITPPNRSGLKSETRAEAKTTNIPKTVTEQLTSRRSEALTQENVAEHLSFIQKLRATQDQLTKNVHYNIPGSVAFFFAKFCEEPGILTIVQQDGMAITAVRLISDRFQTLTFQCLERQERGRTLTASTITDEDIRYECNKIRELVSEYRHMVDEWMKFMEALAVKGVPKFWEKVPWSVNIHRTLADDYDELMRLVKDLRNATPIRFQNVLPRDDVITKFPRGILLI